MEMWGDSLRPNFNSNELVKIFMEMRNTRNINNLDGQPSHKMAEHVQSVKLVFSLIAHNTKVIT